MQLYSHLQLLFTWWQLRPLAQQYLLIICELYNERSFIYTHAQLRIFFRILCIKMQRFTHKLLRSEESRTVVLFYITNKENCTITETMIRTETHKQNKKYIKQKKWSFMPSRCGNGSFMAEHWARSFRNHTATRDCNIQCLRNVEPRCIVYGSNYTGRQFFYAGVEPVMKLSHTSSILKLSLNINMTMLIFSITGALHVYWETWRKQTGKRRSCLLEVVKGTILF